MFQIWWLAASKGSNLHWLCLVIEIFTKQTDKISFAKLWVTIKQTDSKPAWKFSRTCSSNIFATNVKSSERLLIWSCHLLPRRKNSRSRPCVLLRLLLFLLFFFFHKDKSCSCSRTKARKCLRQHSFKCEIVIVSCFGCFSVSSNGLYRPFDPLEVVSNFGV